MSWSTRQERARTRTGDSRGWQQRADVEARGGRSPTRTRESLASDLDAYLAAGGEIEAVPGTPARPEYTVAPARAVSRWIK